MTAPAITGLLAVVFAHQGGWDEILLVGVPILLLAVVLFVADRRARRIRQAAIDAADSSTSDEAG